MRFRSEKQRRLWEKQVDRSTPEIRRLLDEFERVCWDVGRVKLSSDPASQQLCLKVPLRSPGHGYFGVMSIHIDQVRKRVENARREWEADLMNSLGQHI